MRPHNLDPISKRPDKMGLSSRAWELPPKGPVVSCWLIEAPWAHPIWHSYVLSVCHLRPVEATPEPIFYVFGATHEILLQALDPEYGRENTVTKGEFHILTPPNFAAQLIEADDVAAAARCETAVNMIMAQILNPDTDFIGQWICLFGDSMIKKGEKHGS